MLDLLKEIITRCNQSFYQNGENSYIQLGFSQTNEHNSQICFLINGNIFGTYSAATIEDAARLIVSDFLLDGIKLRCKGILELKRRQELEDSITYLPLDFASLDKNQNIG